MGLTSAQLAAIDTSGKTVLVSAAAGSGKTFTLTQRIIKKLLNDKDADISRMLIVTFTRASAQDLKVKISKALSDAITENPGNERLQRQMLLLGDAKICTIDSFFNEPVRSNFEKLGLPASLRFAEDAELDEIRHEIMSDVIEKAYRENKLCDGTSLCGIDASCDFLDFITSLSSSKTTKNIVPLLLEVHKNLMSTTDGVELILKNANALRSDAELEFFSSRVGKAIQASAITTSSLAACKISYYLGRMDEDELVKEKYYPAFEETMTMCYALAQRSTGTYAQTRQAFANFAPPTPSSMPRGKSNAFSKECLDIKKKVKDTIAKFYNNYLALTPDEIKEQVLLTATYNEILYKIIKEYHENYTKYKEEKGLCEFYDMPIYLLRMLTDDNLTVKDTLRALYDEVYIDEYQDVSEIQDKIFEIIGQNRRFMVGDIKQSIYGFRDAVPELFAGYRSKFPKYDEPEAEESDGCTIFMSENFRCDSNVIDFTNTVCPFLFTAAGDKLQYTSDDDLEFNKLDLPEDYVPPRVQINVIETPEDMPTDITDEDNEEEDNGVDGISPEALLCAKEISRLLREENKPDGKPIEKKDIAVLVRVKDDGPVVARALKKYGIEYCLSAKSEIFDGEEMKALLDLMKVIDNPEDDIALCGFLTSPAYCGTPMLSLEEIVTVRKFTPNSKSLMRALREYGAIADGDPLATLLCHRAKDIITLLSRLRAISRRVSVDKLLKEIRACEQFSLICETGAYIYLYDTACNYTKNNWSGLYSFLKYCRKLSEKGSVSFSEATPSNAVNIMTVHQSKGLERNTVFVYNTAHRFSKQDSKKSLNYNSGIGCATRLPHRIYDSEGNSHVDQYVNNIVRDAILAKNSESNILEEMRVLYVALTRARERLYVSATFKTSFERFKNSVLMNGFSDHAKLTLNSYIAWIISAINDPDNNVRRDSFDINVIDINSIRFDERELSANALTKKTNLSENEKGYVDTINAAKNVDISQSTLSIPSKIAASKAAPNLFDKALTVSAGINAEAQDDAERREAIRERIALMRSREFDTVSILDKKKQYSAAEIGTATHAFLQFCDFPLLKENGVESEIVRLVENKFIPTEYAELINRSQIEKFVKSKFFNDILLSQGIQREFEFGILCPASDFATDKEKKAALSGKQVFVQGSIDILAELDNGEIYICDYKTDRRRFDEGETASEFKARLRETHKYQLLQYKKAVSTIFGKEPDRIFIYSLPLGEAIEITI